MEPQFIPCSTKVLPDHLAIDAAKTACDQNPCNMPFIGHLSRRIMEAVGIEPIQQPQHLAVLTSRYWSAKGVVLTVGFMEQTPSDLANRIVLHANAWSKHANVKFVLSNVSPQVRITRSKSGYYSYLGTDILHIGPNQETMCLQDFTMNTPESEFIRVVRHEFGHTLAFPHEHMRQELVNRIDKQKAIAYFARTQGWTPQMTMQQVLTPLSEVSLMGTPHADQTSIMCYQLPGELTIDGQPIIGGSDIDQMDIDFVGKIYPKPDQPKPVEPTKPPVVQPPVPAHLGTAAFTIDMDAKSCTVTLPSGWVAKKASDLV